jgi:HEAT repeat protein
MRPATPAAALLVALGVSGAARAVTEPPPDPIRRGLYEWMGMAPIVVAGDVVSDDGKFTQVVVREAIKGQAAPGTTLLIDVRGANRDRDPGVKPLKFDRAVGYLLLLRTTPRASGPSGTVFELVRGVQGARPLPAEGRPATLDAARKLAALQERHDDELLWSSLPGFLEDDNPVLVDATLDMFVKFRRGDATLVPLLEPLLGHPTPDVRERSILLLGRILARLGPSDLGERSVVVGEITSRARRDDDARVRRTATVALAPLPDAGIDEALRAIARDDPDQDVRFEAERAVFERGQSGGRRGRND